MNEIKGNSKYVPRKDSVVSVGGGGTKVEVRLANESVWLTADQMAELFQRNRSNIQRHINRISRERIG